MRLDRTMAGRVYELVVRLPLQAPRGGQGIQPVRAQLIVSIASHAARLQKPVVETFIRTGDRTAASYLAKPMANQVMRAFRER